MVRVARAWALVLFLQACGSRPQVPAPQPVGSASAPAAVAPVDELDQPLPLDKRLTRGKLDNGLTYYILTHKKPEKRAQIWLSVNAGPVLEDDDQRGLAHFTEHMAFNGTRRFPKLALIDFLEKSGVRFGADLNAYTSFDETVYMLQVPTDQPELLRRSFGVLRDWADGVTFEPDEVDKERSVVVEEWRLGRGAGMRLFDKQAPVVFHTSKYAERIPIGKREIIERASRDAVIRYYRDWYRPDLMAVIAVGDFEASEIEARIKAEFSSLAPVAQARPRALMDVPAHQETLVSIETDPEMPATSVAILSKLPHRPQESARDYRRGLAEQLFNSMLNERLDDLRRKPNAPFLSASSSTSALVRTADVFRQSVSVKDEGAIEGLAALLEEVVRVERHGFTSKELERAKSRLIRRFQQAVKERDRSDGRQFASEIVRHFLQQEAMPGPEAELALAEKFLPAIPLEELNHLGKVMGAGSRVIAVTGPDRMRKPTVEAVLAVNQEVEARNITAHVESDSDVQLMDKPPTAGSVVATKNIPEIEVTEWTLSNGARVIVKPTSFRNDEIRMAAFSPGGHSLVKDSDYDSAQFAASVVGQSGMGPLDEVALRRSLAGKVVSVSARIGELEEGVSGRTTPTDLELMLQMVHLTLTAPRRDESAFASWRASEMERAKNRLLSPERTFFEEMMVFSSQNHRRRRPVTPEVLKSVDLNKVMAIYQERFADVGDFTFLFVGNLELPQLKPLVETYLASLPTKARKETWRDVKVVVPPGVQTKTITKGSEPKSMVSLMFHGKQQWSRDAENDLRTLRDVLRLRLREVLREDMGGVYGVVAGGGIQRRPRQEYSFNIGFGCSPDNVDKLRQAVFDTIKTLEDQGIGEDYIAKVKEMRRRGYETDLRDNGFWLNELERSYTYADDPRLIPDYAPMLEKITSDRVRAAAKRYLSRKQYVLGVLKPAVAVSPTSTVPSSSVAPSAPPVSTPAAAVSGGSPPMPPVPSSAPPALRP